MSTGAGERSLLYSMVRSYNSLLSEVLSLSLGVFKREVLRFSDAWVISIIKCGVRATGRTLIKKKRDGRVENEYVSDSGDRTGQKA